MKVLLAHKFHRLTGGAEVFYFAVADSLKKNGHEVAFFSTQDTKNIDTGDQLFEVPPPTYDSNSMLKKVVGSLDIAYSTSKKTKMIEAIKSFQPDLIHVFAIHVHLTPAILSAAKEMGVPVVMSCNDYKHICPNYKLFANNQLCESCKGGKFYNAVRENCCKESRLFSIASAFEAYTHKYLKVYENLVDRYMFSSQFMLEKTKEFWPNKKVNYGVLKNPFSADAYEPSYQGEYGLYFGRVIDEKGVDILIKALENTTIPFKIIGDGPDLAFLKKYVVSKEITNVEFLGSMWGHDLNFVLKNAKFVVVPSLWHENFPYVIFQSFAAGKPVVGSFRGGIPELIGNNDRGILFDPDSSGELVNSMNKLWFENGLAEKLGREARRYVVDEFSEDVFYRELMSNYQEVLN